MYIIKNAFKSITRNKARNILIGIIALVIAISACVSLSIRQAAETAKEDTLKDLNITAEISYDRSKATQEMKDNADGDKTKFDFSKFQSEKLSLDDYMTYTKAQSDGDSYYYSLSASLNASGDLEPYGNDSSDNSDNDSSSDQNNEMMGGGPKGDMGKGMEFQAQGDFSISGYSSYDAMMSMFGEDGTYTISDGKMFDEKSTNAECIISDELAAYNDLQVGDTITLSNPNYEDETYTLTIKGIYTNSDSNSGSSPFERQDPANNIYMNYNALKTIIDASSKAGNTYTDDNDEQQSAALTSEVKFTYLFKSVENYNKFVKKVSKLGLSDDYVVLSQDLSNYENSLTPLKTLSSIAGKFFLVVLAVGGIILVVLNIFNLRERKYEIGVLTAIGMKKSKVAIQFIYELFVITFLAMIIGSAVGALVSVPITNSLLENQVSKTESSKENINNNFGFNNDAPALGSNSSSSSNNKMSKPSEDGRPNIKQAVNYIDSVSSATNFKVILELIGVGIFLTIIASAAAMITIMRYEPLKILSSRS